MSKIQDRDVIFEFLSIGPYVKVVAMDVATLTEASIQGPAATSEFLLKSNALKKLEYVLRKKGFIE